MKMWKKILLAGMTALGVSLSATAFAEEGELLIWLNADKAYNGLSKVGDEFKSKTGVGVKVEHPDGVIDKFFQSAQAGKGPDSFCWAHDRLGDMVNAGLISPLEVDAKVKDAILPKAWDAFTMGGKIYGYPIALEAVGLIYNKKLVPTPPKNFDEVFELNKTLKKGETLTFLYDYNNFYFSFPLIGGPGGYVFGKQANGDLNPDDVGLNTEGAVKGAELIHKLITDGVMPKGASYSVMESKFNKGELGMMVSGPWAWANLKKNNIDFGVAVIPAIGDKPATPFVGVLGCMINRSTKNGELIKDFLENYVLTKGGLKTLNDDVPIGVPAHKEFADDLAQDANIKATAANVEAGVLMPNIAKMGAVWSAMPGALQNITTGRQDAKKALDHAVAQITRKK